MKAQLAKSSVVREVRWVGEEDDEEKGGAPNLAEDADVEKVMFSVSAEGGKGREGESEAKNLGLG